VVVSTNGNLFNAVFGEIMGHVATAARLGGIVVDGAIRDIEALTRLELPVFSRTVSPGGCDKDGPGEINVPIACAGLVVVPGDVVLGDADGVIAISPARLPQLLADVREKQAQEEEQQRHHLAARTDPSLFAIDHERVDAILRAKGCPV